MSKIGTEETFVATAEVAEAKARGFFERNSKVIAGAALGVIVLVLGGYGYKQLISAPKEEKAQSVMIDAQYNFERDSFNLALNGGDGSIGFKEIVSKYSGTNAGNGAKLYAGISALHVGDYEGAIKYLEGFSTDDPLLNARKYGCIGDAKAELEDYANAASFYQKAIDAAPDNEITAPAYLYKLAKVQVINNKVEEAENAFQTLADKFPGTMDALNAEKELAKLQASK